VIQQPPPDLPEQTQPRIVLRGIRNVRLRYQAAIAVLSQERPLVPFRFQERQHDGAERGARPSLVFQVRLLLYNCVHVQTLVDGHDTRAI
jgi:hypothetical protein